MNIGLKDLSITTVAGTGEATTVADIYGLLVYIGIDAPNGATYIVKVYDLAGYLLYTETTVSGDGYINMNTPVNSTVRVVISSASVDGTYGIRLRYTF